MHDVLLWERLDQPGHESCRVASYTDRHELLGTAVFSEAQQPARLDYHIVCDAAWHTQTAAVTGWLGHTRIAIALRVDSQQHWHYNGQLIAAVSGCIDLDLSFSPATNLLPIRRLQLAVGQAAEVRAAWFRFPAMQLQPLSQVYRRLDQHSYQYESDGGSFVAQLRVNPSGFVTAYPGLWRQV